MIDYPTETLANPPFSNQPDYLVNDLPDWVTDKGVISGKQKNREKKRKAATTEKPNAQIAPHKEILSVRGYREKYEVFMDLKNQERKKLSHDNKMKKMKKKKTSDGAEVTVCEVDKATGDDERPPDVGLILAKKYLDNIAKREKLQRMEAMALLAAAVNEIELPPQHQSEAVLLEKELNNRLAMLRRDPTQQVRLLKGHKGRRKDENKNDDEQENISSENISSDQAVEGTEPNVEENPQGGKLLEEVEGEKVPELPTESNPAINGLSIKMKVRSAASRLRKPEINSANPLTPGRRMSQVAGVTPQEVVQKFTEKQRIRSVLMMSVDLARTDLSRQKLEKLAIQKFYLKLIMLFGWNEKLFEALELERLRVYIAGNPVRMIRIITLQLKVKRRYAEKKRKRRLKALNTLSAYFMSYVKNYTQRIRNEKIEVIKTFLFEQSSQLRIVPVLKAFRFKVLKCQRWSREWLNITNNRLNMICKYIDEAMAFTPSIYGVTFNLREKMAIATAYLKDLRTSYRENYEEYKRIKSGKIDAFQIVNEEQAYLFLHYNLKSSKFVGSGTRRSVLFRGTEIQAGKKLQFKKVGEDLLDLNNIPQVIVRSTVKGIKNQAPFLCILKHENLRKLQIVCQRELVKKELQAAKEAEVLAKLQMGSKENPIDDAQSILSNIDTYLQTHSEIGDTMGARRMTIISSMRAGMPITTLSPEKRALKYSENGEHEAHPPSSEKASFSRRSSVLNPPNPNLMRRRSSVSQASNLNSRRSSLSQPSGLNSRRSSISQPNAPQSSKRASEAPLRKGSILTTILPDHSDSD